MTELFNRKIINCDLIEVILNNRITKNWLVKILDKSFYICMSGICITYDIPYYIYIYVYYINFASINRTNKVLFNKKIINCDLIEVMLNNSYRIKRSILKALDKSFYICMYMYYISMTYVLHVYVYYINFVSINQTNKGGQ